LGKPLFGRLDRAVVAFRFDEIDLVERDPLRLSAVFDEKIAREGAFGAYSEGLRDPLDQGREVRAPNALEQEGRPGGELER